MVASQDAQAAGVLRQHLGDAEFGGEVCNGGGRVLAQSLVPARLLQVAVQVVRRGAHAGHDVPVRGQPVHFFAAHQPEEADRIVAAFSPDLGVQSFEKFPGGPVPGPAQVRGQTGQRPDRLGKNGSDGKSADCLHLRHTNREDERQEPVSITFR